MQQLQDLIANARPGTRIRWFIEIEVPGTPDRTVDLTADGTGEAILITDESRHSGPQDSLAEQRLRGLRDLATGPLKLSEWSKVIDSVWMHRVSERELERAITAGALDGRVKGGGKDHRAVVVEPDEMARYLTLCNAVQRHHEPRPHWWTDVKRGTNADIPEAA